MHLAVAEAAGPSAPLADRLPAGTLAYAGWAGRSLTFDGSMFGQLLNDPDIAKIVRAIGHAIQKGAGDDEKVAFGRAWAMAGITWQHPVALALIDLRKGDHGPDPTGALLLDLDTDREAFAKQLDGLLNLLKEDIPLTEAALDGVTYRVHRPAEGPEFSIGYLGNTLFVGIGAGAPKALIEGPAGGKLSADKKFTECLQAVADGDVQMAYYLDVAGLVGKLDKLAPPPPAGAGGASAPKPTARKIREMAAAMGLGKVSAVAAAMRVVDRGFYSRTRIFTPAPHRGLLMALAGPEVTDTDLAGVPEDADFLLAAKFSAQAVWDELHRAIKGADPDADRKFAKGVGKLEEHLGISIGRGLLSQLGDSWVLSSAPSRGGFLAGTMLTVGVKDPVKLAAALQKVEAGLLPEPPAPPGDDKPSPRPSPDQPRVETLKFARADIRYLVLPSRREPMPLAPAWAMHKNRLMLAAYPQIIQSAIAVNGPAKPVTQTAGFRSARGRIAGKPSVLFY